MRCHTVSVEFLRLSLFAVSRFFGHDCVELSKICFHLVRVVLDALSNRMESGLRMGGSAILDVGFDALGRFSFLDRSGAGYGEVSHTFNTNKVPTFWQSRSQHASWMKEE